MKMIGFDFWWIIPMVMMLAMFIMMIMRGGRGPWQKSGPHDSVSRKSETTLETLERRYADGDITKEEFTQMKSDLGIGKF